MNTRVKVTKIFTFEMGHALLGYDGNCRNIHGHSYKLHVTVEGSPLQNPGNPKDGMVIDFRDLKALVKEKIIHPFDHALVLNERTPGELIQALKKTNQKVILTTFQPTSENLILEFARTIKNELPKAVKLTRLKLFETATSYVDWVAEE